MRERKIQDAQWTRNYLVSGVISFVGHILTTVAYVRVYKVAKYHPNQINSQSQRPIAETMEAIRQQKSAYNFLFFYAVYLACYVPYLPSAILYSVNRSEISLFVPKWASIFLIFLNCSLNPYGLVHFDHLNVTFIINVDFYPPTPRPKYNYDFKKANLIDLKKTLEHILQSVLLPNADTNISLSNWEDVFWSAVDEFVPKKKARDKLTFTPTLPHPPFPPKISQSQQSFLIA